MDFQSLIFLLAFLPAALAGYYLILFKGRSREGALRWLLLCSLVFFAASGWPSLTALAVSILGNYGALLLLRKRTGQGARWILILACAANVAMIALFKYQFAPAGIILTGLSFYTLQQIAYLVDVYRGETEPVPFLRYCWWVAFFAKAPAGPILRHDEMAPEAKGLSGSRFQTACSFILFGLVKKLALAGVLAPIATAVFTPSAHGLLPDLIMSWTAVIAYGGRLYFDFSGYSDIAIGVGLLFGFTLPFNFNSPYKSGSIVEFWRRWHITLSRFLTEYIYFSLPGNRSHPFMRYFNLMLTMLLCGWWHGATLTFVVWGGFHGLLLTVNHAWRATRRALNLEGGSWWSLLLARTVTFLSVMAGWAFFEAKSMPQAWAIVRGLGGRNGIVLPVALSWMSGIPGLGRLLAAHGIAFTGLYKHLVIDTTTDNWWVLVIVAGLMFLSVVGPNTQEWLDWNIRPSRARETATYAWRTPLIAGIVTGVLLFIAIKCLMQPAPPPFVYGRF